MQRCIHLARQGAATVAPNPMVGAVLVHDNRIIGEGYHEAFGQAHAEVNCFASVRAENKQLISQSTLYVSLEPCAHFGKTPPCADLIISQRVPRVVIGVRDPFYAVAGKGIEKLLSAGVEVIQNVLAEDCRDLNKRFFTFHALHRPYVILKWAQTGDQKIGNYGNARLMITNEITNRLVHKWRSEEMAIMVGTTTAALDNPRLTNRLWSGRNPVRVVVDADLRLPPSLAIFDDSAPTIVFNQLKHSEDPQLSYYQVGNDASLVHQVLNGLYRSNITSVMIEGGTKLLQSFIDDGSWDEARVITNPMLKAPTGVPSPLLPTRLSRREQHIGNDVIQWFINKN